MSFKSDFSLSSFTLIKKRVHTNLTREFMVHYLWWMPYFLFYFILFLFWGLQSNKLRSVMHKWLTPNKYVGYPDSDQISWLRTLYTCYQISLLGEINTIPLGEGKWKLCLVSPKLYPMCIFSIYLNLYTFTVLILCLLYNSFSEPYEF